MNVCILCKTDKPSCFKSCDNCSIGLCDKCSKIYSAKLNKLNKEKTIKCNICKTDFYDFCSFCHNQTINFMVNNKLCYYSNPNNDEKKILLDLIKLDEKKWDNLTSNEKNILGDPTEYLKTNWDYCDCDNYSHCYNIANIELKKELGISDFILYERGLHYLLCKDCWYNDFKDEKGTQVI